MSNTNNLHISWTKSLVVTHTYSHTTHNCHTYALLCTYTHMYKTVKDVLKVVYTL